MHVYNIFSIQITRFCKNSCAIFLWSSPSSPFKGTFELWAHSLWHLPQQTTLLIKPFSVGFWVQDDTSVLGLSVVRASSSSALHQMTWSVRNANVLTTGRTIWLTCKKTTPPYSKARYQGKGQRIDYFLLSNHAMDRVESCHILGYGELREGFFCGSDHCASLLVLKKSDDERREKESHDQRWECGEWLNLLWFRLSSTLNNRLLISLKGFAIRRSLQ
jgi:hypothetical protein